MRLNCVIAVWMSSRVLAQDTLPLSPIADRAGATLHVRGYADFLVLRNERACVTNEGRVELLAAEDSVPVATVPIAEPCGAMVDFGRSHFGESSESAAKRGHGIANAAAELAPPRCHSRRSPRSFRWPLRRANRDQQLPAYDSVTPALDEIRARHDLLALPGA